MELGPWEGLRLRGMRHYVVPTFSPRYYYYYYYCYYY